MKHTSGPWTCHKKYSRYFEIKSDGALVADVKLQALTSAITFADEVAEANAKLIAAAPEMLQALEDARITIKAFLPEAFATLHIIESAITKATS